MKVHLVCIVPDDSVPISGPQLVPFIQHLQGDSIALPAIPTGVDVIFELLFKGQDGNPFDMTDYVGVMTCKHSRTSANSVFANAIDFYDATNGIGRVELSKTQTEDEKQRTSVYSINVTSLADNTDEVLPESHFKTTATIVDNNDPVSPPGGAMVLVGLPPVTSGDVGKFLTPTDDDPLTLEWQSVDALPDQTGNDGKILTTDGAAASWEDAPSGGGGAQRLDQILPGQAETAVTLSIEDSVTAGASGPDFFIKGAKGASGVPAGPPPPDPTGGTGTRIFVQGGDGADATSTEKAGPGGGNEVTGGQGGAASDAKPGARGGAQTITGGKGGNGSATQPGGDGGSPSYNAGDAGRDFGGGPGISGVLGIGDVQGDVKIGRSGARVQWFDETGVKSSAYDANPNELVIGDPSGGTFSITLPDATGRPWMIAYYNDSDSNNAVTFSPIVGGQTINGDGSFPAIGPRCSYQFYGNGSGKIRVL